MVLLVSRPGEGFVPINDPRGVPKDVSVGYTKWVDDWGGDGHSHSWLTVAEIMAYDWTQTTRKQGFVDPVEFARWKLTGQPRSWSGDVMGSMIRKISNEEMLAHIEGLLGAPLGWHNLHDLAETTEAAEIRRVSSVSWEIPYTDAGSELLSTILPRLWRLGPPDRVRLVFFFDN